MTISSIHNTDFAYHPARLHGVARLHRDDGRLSIDFGSGSVPVVFPDSFKLRPKFVIVDGPTYSLEDGRLNIEQVRTYSYYSELDLFGACDVFGFIASVHANHIVVAGKDGRFKIPCFTSEPTLTLNCGEVYEGLNGRIDKSGIHF